MKYFLLTILVFIFSCQNPSLTKAYNLNGVGLWDYYGNDKDDSNLTYNYEYKSKPLYYNFRPVVGFMINEDTDVYAYGGVEADYGIPFNFYISPSVAAGYYENNDGKDLGGSVIFKSGGSLKYKFKNDDVVSVGAYRLSNFNLNPINSSADVIQLNYEIDVTPFTKYF